MSGPRGAWYLPGVHEGDSCYATDPLIVDLLLPILDLLPARSRCRGTQSRSGTLPGTGGPSGSTNSRSVDVIRPRDPRLSVIALWSLSETRCLCHPPRTAGYLAHVLITCLLRAPYSPLGRGSAPGSGTSSRVTRCGRNDNILSIGIL